MELQCPWCGKSLARFEPLRGETVEAAVSRAKSFAGEHVCVCRHVNCHSRAQAYRDGGRYFDSQHRRWRCLGGCEPMQAQEIKRSRLHQRGTDLAEREDDEDAARWLMTGPVYFRDITSSSRRRKAIYRACIRQLLSCP